MNAKITLPGLISLLAEQSDTTRKTSEDFIKSFFNTISECLAEGETVRIKRFGQFKMIHVDARKSINVATGEEYLIPEHNKLTFVPDKQVASEVNAPFEMFSSVEINDNVSDSEILEADDENLSVAFSDEDGLENTSEEESSEDCIEKNELPVPEPDTHEGDVDNIAIAISEVEEESLLEEYSEEEIEGERKAYVEQSSQAEIQPTIVEIPSPIKIVGVENEEKKRMHHKSFSKGFLVGFIASFLLIAFTMIVFYFIMVNKIEDMLAYKDIDGKLNTEMVENSSSRADVVNVVVDTKAKRDSVVNEVSDNEKVVADTHPSDTDKTEPEYDIVSTTRYLTTIAKDHYGNYQLWPYIYKENEKILGHPDRIRPGTKVVVPDLKKYGVNPRSKADIKKAVDMGVEIYAKYK